MQSKTQAARSWMGHYGSDGSTAKDRAARAGYHAKIASENVASGQKSSNVTAIGVAMAKDGSGRAYWTLVLAGE
jgi:uncharacterized protein YkwD